MADTAAAKAAYLAHPSELDATAQSASGIKMPEARKNNTYTTEIIYFSQQVTLLALLIKQQFTGARDLGKLSTVLRFYP